MLTLWRVALLLQLLGQPCSNINGALWLLVLLPCFWWTFSRQWRAKGLAVLVTGIIEVVGLVWRMCVNWTLNGRVCILVNLDSGLELSDWFNRDGNMYLYIIFHDTELHCFCIVVDRKDWCLWPKIFCVYLDVTALEYFHHKIIDYYSSWF